MTTYVHSLTAYYTSTPMRAPWPLHRPEPLNRLLGKKRTSKSVPGCASPFQIQVNEDTQRVSHACFFFFSAKIKSSCELDFSSPFSFLWVMIHFYSCGCRVQRMGDVSAFTTPECFLISVLAPVSPSDQSHVVSLPLQKSGLIFSVIKPNHAIK